MSTIDSATQRTNTVSLADEEGVKKVLLRSVLGLWDVVSTHLNDEDVTAVAGLPPCGSFFLHDVASGGGKVGEPEKMAVL